MLCMFHLRLNEAFEFRHFKNASIKNAKVKDILTTPKSLLGCCSTCMEPKSCKGVQFDGKTCTRFCDLAFDSKGTSSESAFIDHAMTESKKYFLNVLNIEYFFPFFSL